MVYLLHAHFGREGREEAEQLLKRNSGDRGSHKTGRIGVDTPMVTGL